VVVGQSRQSGLLPADPSFAGERQEKLRRVSRRSRPRPIRSRRPEVRRRGDRQRGATTHPQRFGYRLVGPSSGVEAARRGDPVPVPGVDEEEALSRERSKDESARRATDPARGTPPPSRTNYWINLGSIPTNRLIRTRCCFESQPTFNPPLKGPSPCRR
jgi:hypothetical protein